jgi:hypothetical protein
MHTISGFFFNVGWMRDMFIYDNSLSPVCPALMY